ncbi:hypothetical protein SFRURICE_012637, partial [Spodoptera frugiperda]
KLIRSGKNKVLLASGYLYNRRHNARDQNWGWYCTRYHHGCKARIITDDAFFIIAYNGEHDHVAPGEIIKIGKAEMLLAGGYTFNRKQCSKNKQWRWYCTRYHHGCKAAVLTTMELVVTTLLGEHNHGLPNLYYTKQKADETLIHDIAAELLKTGRGKVLHFNGYTYSLRHFTKKTNLSRWYCSRYCYRAKCKAVVITSDHLEVTSVVGEHNHSPPSVHHHGNGLAYVTYFE